MQVFRNKVERDFTPTVPPCDNCRQWETWGIIEIAVRNPNVMAYMEHWEARALKAEARLEAQNDNKA